MKYSLAVEIEPLAEGGYLASCPAIPGCHAEGSSVGAAVDHLRDVARVLYDLSREKDLFFVPQYPDAKPDTIVWQVQIPVLEPAI